MEEIKVEDIEKSMDEAIKQLQLFQDKLLQDKPENYLRDINMIDGLKRMVNDMFRGLKHES